MARPKNRYARAQARARYRKPKRRNTSLPWIAAIAVIVVVGVVLIAVSRSDRTAGASPRVGEHWHAQFTVFLCGSEEPQQPTPEFEVSTDGERVGVHTHGDGFIHIHPFNSGESGDDATVGRFLDYQGYDADEDSFELWGDIGTKRNGDLCPDGQPGAVRWSVNGRERNGSVADYKPADGDRIVLAFLPEGQEIPASPDLTQTQD
jgi:hypothetical protein